MSEALALPASPSPTPEPSKIGGGLYTNFPTVHLGSHVLLLRPSWPEDLDIPMPSRELGSLAGFGAEGEVLTISDKQGQTVAALRVRMRQAEGLPDPGTSPWPGALALLRTALRYSRMGWLETGPASLKPVESSQPPHLAGLRSAMLWHGLVRLLERNGLGFALGLSLAPPPDADAPVTDMLPLLLEKHGLPAEFAYRPTKFIRRASPSRGLGGEPEDVLPVDLREALRRGAKLCGEPLAEISGRLSYFWVAHRSVLQRGLPTH